MAHCCEVCNYESRTLSDYNKHIKSTAHKTNIKITSSPKPLRTKKKSDVNKDVSTDDYNCENCGKKFITSSSLARHQEFVCIKQKSPEELNTELVLPLIMYGKSDLLAKHLANITIEYYNHTSNKLHTPNPDKYTIRNVIDEHADWTKNKNGLNTGLFIVEPLLEYLREELNKHIRIYGKLMSNMKLSVSEMEDYLNSMQQASQIVTQIEEEVLKTSILKIVKTH
jgi:hypothetical protein